jgi:arylsulfatase A-like enzyme
VRTWWLPSFVATAIATTGAFLAWRAGGATDSRSVPPAASVEASSATPRKPGGGEAEEVTVRLIDALKDARYEAPSLRAGLAALDGHWRKMQVPWTALSGPAARAAISYALLTSDEETEYVVPLANGDVWRPDARQWNMAEGAFDQRNAIFAPSPSSIVYRLSIPLAAALDFSITTDNFLGSEVVFAVHVKDARGADKEVWTRGLGRHDVKKWIDARVDLSAYAGQTVDLTLTTDVKGEAWGVPALAMWGNPVLVARQPTRVPYNVLWIVVDATRADAVASFHDDEEDARKNAAPMPPLEALLPKIPALSPSLDDLGKHGVRFTHAYSVASWTRPGTVAMLGGARSTELGLDSIKWQLPDSEVARFYASSPPLLPLLLRRQGMITRAFVNNYFMVGYAAVGVDLGFEAVHDFRFRTKDTGEITTHTIEWLKGHKDQRFFLFCNYNSPHEPLDPPARFLAKVPPPPAGPKDPQVAKYMAEVGKDDEAIGMLMRTLDELGLRDHTIVVMTADHGETLSSAHAGTSALDHMKVRFHHSASNYEETTHVPILISLPGKLPVDVSVAPRVRTIDIAPTILDLEGLELGAKMTGTTLVPLARGEAEAEPRVVVSEGRGTHGIIVDNYRLLTREGKAETVIFGTEEMKMPIELFDLTADPGERKNLLKTQPDKAAEMRARLEAALHAAPVTGSAAAHATAGEGSSVTTITLRWAGRGEAHRVAGVVWVDAGATLRARLVGLGAESMRAGSGSHHEGVELAFVSPPEAVTGVDLEVSPGASAVHWDLYVDDRKLAAQEVYAGPFGFAAPGVVSGVVTDDDRLAAFSPALAEVDARRDFGLFVTRERGSEPEAVVRATGAAGAEEMSRLMREWGYAHDKTTTTH